IVAVLLAWDAETATGRPRVPNDLVAEAVRMYPKTFVGFGSVDPLKGDRAVEDVDRIAELGLKGVKLHPSLQAFAPNEERHWPLYEKCQDLGLIVLFHTGTSGIGAGQPGGQGIRIDFARPIWLDAPRPPFPTSKSSPRISATRGTWSCSRWPCTRPTSPSTSPGLRRATSRPRSYAT